MAGTLDSDTLPAGSVAFAVTSPAGNSFVGVIVAFPSFPATPSPIFLPSLSNNSTLDPGSAVTSTGSLVPALPVKSVLSSGLAGAFVSGVAGDSGLELGSFGSVPFSTSSLSVTPSPSVSALVGSVPFSASSLSVKPSPSVSLVVGSSGELGSLTVTLTGTSSLDPSGYVTTTVASLLPGVAVATGSLKATFVPLGRSFTFPIESSAFGVVPLFTVCGLAVGVFLSASVGLLVTNSDNGFVSFEPSAYVTTRFPLLSFVTDLILASLSVTGASFEIFASSLSFLCSSCSFSLILANSASVTFAGSVTATFSVGALISYLSV